MKNLYRFLAFSFLGLALVVDYLNTDLAAVALLYATCALLICALVFLLIGFDMQVQEDQRSDLFTRRAHEANSIETTFEVDGATDYQPKKQYILKRDPFAEN